MTIENYPVDHQTLFEFAIKAQCSVNGEFYGRHEAWVLRHWAKGYAKAHNLKCPVSFDTFGIYYDPDPEEIDELTAEGIF